MQGLFPFSSTIHKVANQSCFDGQESSKHRVIIMIIDALRSDYIFNRNHLYYLKTIENIEKHGNALSIKLRCHTPTVTLPRLKSILTGTIPSFWDVIFNYNSTKLELDNLLLQYKIKYPNNKIIFYGDDTWIKLFPDNTFYRSKGLQSFFVTDFKKIDSNVTEGLYQELNRTNEWNLLIVHYLGLDHIGHAHGAFNHLIKDKLNEYDLIIENIYNNLSENDLLIITGDHGMSDKGGHGGSSLVETSIPVSFISKNLMHLENFPLNDEYLQIDLTSTLSSLLEVPIPLNNIGILIEPVLNLFYQKTKPNLLKCLFDDNKRQLLKLLSNDKLSIDINNLKLIRDQAISMSNKQNFLMILLSILIFILSTILLWFYIEIKSLITIVFLLLFYFIFEDFMLSLSLFLITFCLFVLKMNKRCLVNYKFNDNRNLSNIFLNFYPLFNMMSLFSSSFIEEEHRIWYFLLSTYLLLKTFEKKSSKFLFLLILSRLIRSWNQTGNKWLNLKDIRDFLNQNENIHYLFINNLFSTILFVYLLIESKNKYLSYLLGIILFIYRWNLIGSISTLIPIIYYLLLILMKIYEKLSIENLLFSLLLILRRTHNTFVIVVHMIFYKLIEDKDFRLLFILSQAGFYHLGNSNSFVTIDVSSGFVGIPIYISIIHGLFIYLSTFGLSILWLLNLSNKDKVNYLIHLTMMNNIFAICMLIQRYHLFIWTVFSPKLFYLFSQTFFNLFIFIFIK